MAGANLSRNKDLAGQSVKQGQYTVTYDENGYATKAKKDGGASATSSVKTTHANDSEYHQKAYQAAQQGNWDEVGGIMNQYSEKYGRVGENDGYNTGLNLKAANDYIAELQNEFLYNANNYYQGKYDSVYGEGAWDGGTGTGKPVYNDYSQNLVAQYYANQANSGTKNTGSSAAVERAAVTNPYAGTNYHQDAINAAQAGDWAAVLAALRERDEKTMNTGENYGKASSDIYQELLNLYGGDRTTTTNGFTYEDAPEYYDDYQVQIDAALNRLLNRDAFSYNYADDPMYQQYQQMYEREGDRAMRDTLGEVAARTGGLASTYATTAATQANQYYMQQLADKVPELQQLAYQMYLDDINLQVQDLGLLQNASSEAYNRYRDTMTDWYNDRNFAYGSYRDDIADQQWQTQFDYNAERDSIADQRYNTEWEYQLSRDELADQRYDTEWAYGVSRDQVADEQWLKSYNASLRSTGNNNNNNTTTEDPLVAAVADITGYDYNTVLTLKNKGSAVWTDALAQLGISDSTKTGNTSGNDAMWDRGSNSPDESYNALTLGLAAPDASLIMELTSANAIYEDSSGKLRWKDGWSANNYQQKLTTAKSYNPFISNYMG